KTAIEAGDALALRQLLTSDPSLANARISWGPNCDILTHPLHYISDMIAARTLEAAKAAPLVDALIEAGADVNFRQPGHGETALIGAASLGAEEVGLQLLDAGADPNLLGCFGETALHWASLIGADRLVGGLIAKGASVDRRDGKYDAAPLGWALHGWGEPQVGDICQHRDVVRRLLAAGAI